MARMKVTSWTRIPTDALIQATRKRVDSTGMFVAAGSLVDTAKMEKKRVERMLSKAYPTLVELEVTIADGANTLVWKPGDGAKVHVDKSVGREHAPESTKRRSK